MIAILEGKLAKLDKDHAVVQVASLGYEVMLPGYVVTELSDRIGTDVRLCTMEYYEGTPVGGNLIPRIIGFLNSGERDFFLKFVTVKGIGIRKGLKLLSMPIATIAAAIENGEQKSLMQLPGVGKRMADQIIAELKGKMQTFALGAESGKPAPELLRPFQAEALEILIA